MTSAETVTNQAHTIPQAISNAARLWPDKTWLDFSGEKLSYAQADAASTRLAHGLSRIGIGRGDRVCSILDNHADAVLLLIALSKIGAISVPINTAYRGEFLRHQVADSGSVIIVADAEYVGNIIAIEEGIPDVRAIFHRGALASVPTRFELRQFESVYSDDQSPIDNQIAPSDLALLLYTSGTTGPSKGCMVSHNYVLNAGWQSSHYVGLRHDDVYWLPLPLFHMGAFCITLGVLQMGATISIYPRFSLSAFWPEIERSGATIALLMSSMLNYVADAPDTEVSKRCFGQLRTIGGTPFSAKLQKQWKERFGARFTGSAGYAMTEACSMLIDYAERSTPAPPGSSGRRCEDFDVQIVDDQDRVLPAGESGEIVVRPLKPDVMFQGYWRRPEATVEAYRNLWFHTGDIGRFDEQGFFYFVDRKKDYLRRGGENISSFEMEVAFYAHPDIAEVAVHAVTSDSAEDDVKVTAILRPGAELTYEVLCYWAIDKLPAFAVPRYIEFRSEFPRTGTGKVQKYELRRQGVTPETWDRHTSDIVFGKAKRR